MRIGLLFTLSLTSSCHTSIFTRYALFSPFMDIPATRSLSSSHFACRVCTNFGCNMAGIPSLGGPPLRISFLGTMELSPLKPLYLPCEKAFDVKNSTRVKTIYLVINNIDD